MERVTEQTVERDWFWPWTLFVWLVVMPGLLTLIPPAGIEPMAPCDSGPYICPFVQIDLMMVQVILRAWFQVILGTFIYALPLILMGRMDKMKEMS